MKRFLLFLVIALELCSCKQENPPLISEPIPVDLEIDGLKINKKKHWVLNGTIPCEGLRFYVSGTGEYSERAFISKVEDFTFQREISFSPIDDNKPPFFGSNEWLKGEWWQVNYIDVNPPYKMEIVIYGNPSKEKRELEFTYNFYPFYTILHLTQEAAK